MRRRRRTFTAEFRAEVALAALRGDKTLPQIARIYDLTTTQVSQFRKLAVERLPRLFCEDPMLGKVPSHGLELEDRVHVKLTVREREVLEVVTKGLNQSEAGELLGISRRTVEVHKRRIMAKLHVNSVSELIRFALKGDRPKRELESSLTSPEVGMTQDHHRR
jgi:DNA-binding NarL/FixJ family response regulator